MTKSDLIKVLALQTNIPRNQAGRVVNLIFDAMTGALSRGDRIEIRGFGSLENKHYPGYDGRNPKTGEVIQVKEKNLPFFKVGKELRDRVNGKSKKKG